MDNNAFIIGQLLAAPENDSLCLVEALQPEFVTKMMVAMSNHRGGTIIVGVADNGKVLGIENVGHVIDDLHDFVRNSVSPRLPYNVLDVEFEHKHVAMISVWEGSVKPYLFRMQAYVKVGDSIRIADSRMLEELFHIRSVHDESWERERVFSADIDDLDLERVRMVQNLIDAKKNQDCDEEEFLVRQGLLVMDVPTNAAIVLFAKNPAQFLPQTRVRVSVYNGADSMNLLEAMIFDGNLFENVERVTDYCKALYGTTIRIDGMERQQVPMLPIVAFREALLNAMVHRDYSSHRSFLNIVVYADRLQVSNYGSLPEGITVESLSKEHHSILRNQDMANICYLSNYIEVAGSGTLRILDECSKRLGVTAEWTDENNIVTVTINGIKHMRTERRENPLRASNAAQQHTLDSIVTFVGKNPGCKLMEIQNEIGKSLASTKRYVQILRENGVIAYEGAPKTGGYKLI